MEKRSTLFLSLFCCITVCSARCADSISVLITQPEVYIVKNEWAQQINFNPNIANRSSEAVTLERIELCAYDASSRPICQKVLRDGPLMPSIGTVPNRNIPAGGRLTVFNPFTVFPISNFCTCVTYWRSAVNRSGALRPKSNSRPGFTNPSRNFRSSERHLPDRRRQRPLSEP